MRPEEDFVQGKDHPAVNAPPQYKEALSRIRNVLFLCIGEPFKVLQATVDASYLYGGGINIDWQTFWDYKTIQARAVHAWLQDLFVQARGVNYYRDKLSDAAQLHIIAAWVISQAPLALQQGMNDIIAATQQGFQLDDWMSAAEERAVAFL